MNVLSLFDGISCCRLALDRSGIAVDNYYASEIDKYAIMVAQNNYPDTNQLGDITNWRDWDIDWSSIDLVTGGFPCQAWSMADKQQAEKGNTAQYIEFRYDGKSNSLSTVTKDNVVVPFTLPNRIPNDLFLFRYITPLECERLQTLPDNWTQCVSNSQRYKMIGNAWTVDVVAHLFRDIAKIKGS
jgi:site-specific DNA-cytosine methylase